MTDQQMSWREHLLNRAQRADLTVHYDHDSTPADDASWDEALRKQQLAYMETQDPNATLEEELLLRLVGPGADGAGLRLDWAKLPEYFAAALAAFSPSDLSLRVTGYSSGSTVVHFTADAPEVDDDAVNVGPIHQTPLAVAAHELLKAMATAEAGEEVVRWASQIAGLERFIDELVKRQLEVGVRYFESSGRVHAASLTGSGITYLRSLREHQDQDDIKPLSGRVTELREAGVVRVKTGVQRNSPAQDVRFEDEHQEYLHSLRLGQQVHWIIRQTITVDRLHREDHGDAFFVSENNEQTTAF